MAKSISLYPPTAPSDTSVILSVQPFMSQYFLYILKRSPANKAASSPPVPARISICTFFASSGSFGTRSSLISSSNLGCRLSFSCSSSRAISFMSASSSFANIFLASLIESKQEMYLFLAFMMSPKSFHSLVSFTYLF